MGLNDSLPSSHKDVTTWFYLHPLSKLSKATANAGFDRPELTYPPHYLTKGPTEVKVYHGCKQALSCPLLELRDQYIN